MDNSYVPIQSSYDAYMSVQHDEFRSSKLRNPMRNIGILNQTLLRTGGYIHRRYTLAPQSFIRKKDNIGGRSSETWLSFLHYNICNNKKSKFIIFLYRRHHVPKRKAL